MRLIVLAAILIIVHTLVNGQYGFQRRRSLVPRHGRGCRIRLLTKYAIGVLVIAMAGGLLLTPSRRLLKSPYGSGPALRSHYRRLQVLP